MADIPEDDRLWWFLFVLRACGKSGAESNGDPEEWVAAFCDDVEPTDTFNRACALGFALCTHNSLFDTSTVWITEKGKAWLVAHADRLTRQDPETIRQAALEEADGWQPIATAPMSFTPVLGLINGSASVIAKSKDNRWCEVRHLSNDDGVGTRFPLSENAQPSHWIPFPIRAARDLKEAGYGL